MNSLSFQLVTPERTVLSEELLSLTCPTNLGEISIHPGHIPLVATLVPGELHARSEKGDFYVFVSGGFVEVQTGNKVVVLADAAEHHYEIDAQRAEEAVARAQKELSERQADSKEYAAVAAALERSLGRVNLARKHARRKTRSADSNTLN